jgi:peptide chain release factor 1
MIDKLREIEARHQQLSEQLSSQEVASDMQQLKTLSKQYKELGTIVEAGKLYQAALAQLDSARELLTTEHDEEMREMAKEEITSLEPKVDELEQKVKNLLIPKDPNDSKDVILEIRGGTGGDEAALFAGDLFRMYQRFCEVKGWKFDVTDFHEGTAGGFRDVTVSISGEDCFGTLKFESGVHRVQRVPDTETQGRVHTSAATVAVLPEAEDFEIEVKEADIRKDTFMSSGNGGQSVNTTYSAVRLTHLPSGIVISMQNERSQIKNYDLAMKLLKAKLFDIETQKRHAEQTAMRRSMVSTGDRSAKIRTYNYPQSRVTDHRIGMTVYNLQAVLLGQLDEFIEALRMEENAARLAEASPA